MAPAHQEKQIIGCQECRIMFGRMPKNRTKENRKGEEWIRNFLRRSDILSPFKTMVHVSLLHLSPVQTHIPTDNQ